PRGSSQGAGSLAEPATADRDRATGADLSRMLPLQLCPGICADLPDAVDGTKGDVRPAQPDLPPLAAHACRFLRAQPGATAGDEGDHRGRRAARDAHPTTCLALL